MGAKSAIHAISDLLKVAQEVLRMEQCGNQRTNALRRQVLPHTIETPSWLMSPESNMLKSQMMI